MRQGDVTARLAQNKQFAGVKNDIGGLIVTADSAVSVQFDVYNYLHTSYQPPVLSGSFPAGLRLILADITDSQKPRYFYYTAAEAKTEVPLTDFVSMADGATRFATRAAGGYQPGGGGGLCRSDRRHDRGRRC